jgi:hypothetical protein
MQTQKITLSGGFHNSRPIDLRLKTNELSVGQYKRLDNHMCGVDKCICGWRGFDLQGIDPAVFFEMLVNVNYKIYSGSK